MITVITSLFANPPHLGHIDYINSAYNFGLSQRRWWFEKVNLYIICNNDLQIEKKGGFPFYNAVTRVSLIKKMYPKATVWYSGSLFIDVAGDLLNVIKDQHSKGKFYFCNSGDREPKNWNEAENDVCKNRNITQVFLPGVKTYSSSKLIENAVNWELKRRGLIKKES